MAARTPKTKSTVVNTPFVDIPHAVPEATLFEQLSAQIPDDWRRRSVAFVAGLITSFGTGYAVGALTEMAMVGAVLLTGSLFMALLVFLIGLIVAMYYGSKGSMFVYANIMNKNIDKVWASANTTVRGWFTSAQGVTA